MLVNNDVNQQAQPQQATNNVNIPSDETLIVSSENTENNTNAAQLWRYIEHSLAKVNNSRILKPSLTPKSYLKVISHIEEDETDCLLGYN